jgi:hypothetical protein
VGNSGHGQHDWLLLCQQLDTTSNDLSPKNAIIANGIGTVKPFFCYNLNCAYNHVIAFIIVLQHSFYLQQKFGTDLKTALNQAVQKYQQSRRPVTVKQAVTLLHGDDEHRDDMCAKIAVIIKENEI